MKKIYLVVSFVLLLSLTTSYAQQYDRYHKGDFMLSGGIGAGYYYAGGATLSINGEYSVTDEIGVGGYFGYTHWNYGYIFGDYKYNFIDIGARASYHFGKLLKVRNDKFDPYAGAFLGFVSSSYTGPNGAYRDAYDGGLRTGIHVGARYFFTENFAGFGEIGAGFVPILIGVSYKF